MHKFTLEEELKFNTKVKQEHIDQLKEWHRTQPHLPKMRDSDYALFLHKHYYGDMEMTRITIDKYFTLRTHSPEHFRNRDPLNSHVLRQGFDTLAVLPLEKRTRKGFKVVLMRLLDTNPSVYNYNHTVTYMNAVMDVCIRDEGTCGGMCRGYVFVFDLSGYTLEHAGQLTWMGLKKLIDYYMDGAPIRWVSAHFIDTNNGAIDPHAKRLVESHITDLEISELSFFHKDMESLNKFVPLSILPNEMGGQAGALMDLHRAQMEKLKSHRDWLIMSETSYVVREHLRTPRSYTMTDVFGREKRFTASAEDI